MKVYPGTFPKSRNNERLFRMKCEQPGDRNMLLIGADSLNRNSWINQFLQILYWWIYRLSEGIQKELHWYLHSTGTCQCVDIEYGNKSGCQLLGFIISNSIKEIKWFDDWLLMMRPKDVDLVPQAIPRSNDDPKRKVDSRRFHGFGKINGSSGHIVDFTNAWSINLSEIFEHKMSATYIKRKSAHTSDQSWREKDARWTFSFLLS